MTGQTTLRLDHVRATNFKKFEDQRFDFNPHFTLLVGENGSGKTSVLDALAVALGVWLVDVPDTTVRNSRRSILSREIRLEPASVGDRIQFREMLPVEIHARGQIDGHEDIGWTRQIRAGGQRTTDSGAHDALAIIRSVYERDASGDSVVCPVLAYYGAGRAWLPSSVPRRLEERRANGLSRRWAAFVDCFNERIRFEDIRAWFRGETIAAGNRGGHMRPGFEVVKRSVLSCVPGAEQLWFDPDLAQVVLSIDGVSQPFDNLSAGQRMMLALVADIAIKAVTQNAHLLPPDRLGPEDEPVPRVLRDTPGVVLIDELDVHLHPRWQRRVASDLKRTFPALQFICTSHSPQVIGELEPDEIRILEEGAAIRPPRSLGVDSDRILEELMDTPRRNREAEEALSALFDTIDQEDFTAARASLLHIEAMMGADDPEVTRARTLMTFLEQTS